MRAGTGDGWHERLCTVWHVMSPLEKGGPVVKAMVEGVVEPCASGPDAIWKTGGLVTTICGVIRFCARGYIVAWRGPIRFVVISSAKLRGRRALKQLDVFAAQTKSVPISDL